MEWRRRNRLGAGLPRRALVSARPVFLATGVFALVVLAIESSLCRSTGPFSRYTAEVVVMAAVGLGALATWWAMRRGSAWDADLWPAILGGIAAWSLLSALHGTPYAPNGLQGDQAFGTETLTRYADTWRLVDFTYDGLPAFYAPGFFWVLGRLAHFLAVEPWRMEKVGTVATAMVVPLVTFLFWRRQVPLRVAVLIAAVPLVVENYYEPYSWLVLVAFVPWWLEAVHGITRPGVRAFTR